MFEVTYGMIVTHIEIYGRTTPKCLASRPDVDPIVRMDLWHSREYPVILWVSEMISPLTRNH